MQSSINKNEKYTNESFIDYDFQNYRIIFVQKHMGGMEVDKLIILLVNYEFQVIIKELINFETNGRIKYKKWLLCT